MEDVIKIGLPGNFHPRVQFPPPIPQNYPGSNHLPPSIRLRILNYTIHRIVTQGGSDAASVVRGLARMASVCRKWKRVAYREREKGWMKAGHEGMSNTLGKGARLHDYLEDAPNGERCVGGALTLVVVVCEPGGDVSKLHRTWDKHLVDVARACSNTKSLMMEVNNGRRLNLAGEFKCLEKLYISSAQTDLSIKIFKPIESIFHPLPRTLTRLDLARIDIPTWDAYLPLLKTLTLNHISFGRANSPESRLTDICQRFFNSFPSLTAIGLNGLGRMQSIAFTQLKPTVVHLALGTCVFPEEAERCISEIKKPLVEHLARHFRCKIKHLTLPNDGAGGVFLRELLESRQDGTPPIYLRGLETIKIATEGFYRPEMAMGMLYLPDENGKLDPVPLIEETDIGLRCRKYKCPVPRVTRWEPEEIGHEMVRWEPKEW